MKIVKRFDCRVEWLEKGAQGTIKVDSSIASQSPHCTRVWKSRQAKEGVYYILGNVYDVRSKAQ